jgi:prolyl 4-hydroxylase
LFSFLGCTENCAVDVGKVKADGTFERNISSGRTSTNTWCHSPCSEDEVISPVIERLNSYTEVPDVNAEYLQLLRYEKDQFYQVHHDYIPFQRDRQEGCRILTAFLYLSNVEAGGGTRFDKLDLTVLPKAGRMLLWPSVLDESPHKMDDRTTHTALPVEDGVKYGANAWFHQRDFKTPNSKGCS